MSSKILFVVDCTGSMSTYLNSLKHSLWEIFQMTKLTQNFELGILWYRDYCDSPVTGFSGFSTDYTQLYNFISKEFAKGGGDNPEAVKTALHQALSIIDEKTIIILYTDAPPHSIKTKGDNWEKECRAIKSHDWVKLTHQMSIPVYSFISHDTGPFYIYLSTQTGGRYIKVDQEVSNITKSTISVLLALMGHSYPEELKQVEFKEHSLQFSTEEQFLNKLIPVTSSRLEIQSNPNFVTGNLIKKFDTDENYRNTVYSVYKDLLQPEHALSLTTNSLFGLLWRVICKRRYDGDSVATRRDNLLSQLDFCLQKMQKNEVDIMRKWIAESYNSIEEINEVVSKVSQFPALVNMGPELTREELLMVSRECTPTSIKNVISLISSINVVESVSEGDRYLPLALSNSDLFGMLPHLMAPGLKFSFRPSVFIATLFYLHDHLYLKSRAEEYLLQSKGKWFDATLPENYTYEFIRWMLKAPQFLTEKELTIFNSLYTLSGVKHNLSTMIKTIVPYTPKLHSLYSDNKKECVSCHEMRSISLIREDGTCGICYYGCVAPEKDRKKSHLVECHTCNGIYAVVRPEQLVGTPKCHACRNGYSANHVFCTICKNKYIIPSNMSISSSEFVCEVCVENQGKVELEVSTANLINENPILLEALNLKMDKSDFDKFHSLFSIKDLVQWMTIPPSITSLIHHNKVIFNVDDVLTQLSYWVKCGDSQKTVCYLCAGKYRRNIISPACGNCNAEACLECLKSWYGQVKHGQIVNPNHLTCPFCKRSPKGNLLALYNKQAMAIHKIVHALRNDVWLAWCQKCYRVKEFQEKSCGQSIPTLKEFVCDDCQTIIPTNMGKVAPCCGVIVSKIYGCPHMTCVCGNHWCWDCVQLFTEDTIYPHIWKTHRDDDGEYNSE